MKLMKRANQFLSGVSLAVALSLGVSSPVCALNAYGNYNVVVYKVNSDGSTTSVSSTSATADANGKIAFSFSSLPTVDEAKFMFIEVQDSAGSVVRRAFAPAPAAGETNAVGINTLSDVQAEAISASMADNGTDDPLGVAFGLIFVKSPDLQDSDIETLADMMGMAILGPNGLKQFLLDNGVSASKMAVFQEKMVANTASNAKDMADYMEFFKTAIDNDDDDEMAKAGSIMADIWMDAALAADIDPGLILAAFNAAGNSSQGGETLDDLMSRISSGFAASIEQAVQGFFMRIAGSKLKAEYTDALNELDASGAEVNRFNSAVQTFLADQQAIDVQYSEFFVDPEGYVANSGQSAQQIQTAIDNAFQSAWSTFKDNLQSTTGEISDMLDKVSAATAIAKATLQGDGVGQERDYDGNTVRWPIPQTVSVSWVADVLIGGGSFDYTRDTTAVPSNMSWLNGTGTRSDFGPSGQNLPDGFSDLMGLMEDVQIIEHVRFNLWDSGQPTPAQEEAARLAYLNALEGLVSNISGTTDGSVNISAEQKEALVKMMQEPSLF